MNMMLMNAVFSAIVVCLEIRQLWLTGFSYFLSPYNYLDVGGNIAMIFIVFERYFMGIKMFDSKAHKIILVYAFIGVGLRAFTNLRVFTQYRVLIDVFVKIFEDIAAFTVILALLVYLMSVSNSVLMINEEDHKDDDVWKMLPTFLGMQYLIMFGENIESDVSP